VRACEDVKRQILERAATMMEANIEDLEIEDKKVFVKGTSDKSVSISQIAFDGVYNYMDPATGNRMGIPGQIQGYASHFPASNSPPFAATFVEVEIDIETGELEIIEVVNAHDIGRAIHPPSVEGQLEGGVQQGLGMALTEETYYDDKGMCLNSSFTDYKMLGPSDMPKCRTILVEDPDPIGPYGAKSVGESGLVTPVGATANAVYNALGIQFKEAPIIPEKILKAIKEHGIS
jgi:xanthine dehydrogenase molybdenum-binding subunit